MANNNNPKMKPKKKRSDLGIFLIAFLIIVMGIYFFGNNSQKPLDISYHQFVSYIQSGDIASVNATTTPGENNGEIIQISGTLSNDMEYTVVVPTTEKFNDVIDEIEQYNNQAGVTNIDFTITPASSFDWLSFLMIVVPFVIVFVVIFFIMRSSGGNNKAFDFAKSRAKLSKGKTATFKDVAGADEEKQELEEIIDFLKNPKKYLEIGARIPKGTLLVGPPGTGKTLLARAVAGEANVPFYSISGSDFVEMFVGVGASRVRDMFKAAKQNAPCIVFIDEIDAVGRQRGAGLGGGHDEREQTLNQLLVEMDGFGANSGVIVMAATNRPDILDPALLRPGRFDRQITIGNPDVKGRTAILQVHARNKKLNKAVRLDEIARRCPGFSGADLENLLNEAALLAARENRKTILMRDLDEAIDRTLMGPAKRSRKYSVKERNMVAHHEAGHAVVGVKLENAAIVQKVTIVPRGKTGGYAMMLDEEEKFLDTKQGLLDSITGLMAGRVSEEVNFGEITTGAHNDFQKATTIARAMVTEYGMSDLGPVQYERTNGQVFLGRDYNKDKNFSDQVALEIDQEVRTIINQCYDRATKVITENLQLVKLIATYLLEIETLTKEDIYEIVDTNTLEWWEKEKEEKKRKEQEAIEMNEKQAQKVEDKKDETGQVS